MRMNFGGRVWTQWHALPLHCAVFPESLAVKVNNVGAMPVVDVDADALASAYHSFHAVGFQLCSLPALGVQQLDAGPLCGCPICSDRPPSGDATLGGFYTRGGHKNIKQRAIGCL